MLGLNNKFKLCCQFKKKNEFRQFSDILSVWNLLSLISRQHSCLLLTNIVCLFILFDIVCIFSQNVPRPCLLLKTVYWLLFVGFCYLNVFITFIFKEQLQMSQNVSLLTISHLFEYQRMFRHKYACKRKHDRTFHWSVS